MRWTIHGERPVYDSEWMRLVLVDVEIPGGARFDHHVVRYPQHASGTIVHDDRSVLLIWRHRFITDTWGWEIPAGRSEPGETPEQAAVRETLEETGWAPTRRATARPTRCSTSSRRRAPATWATRPTPARAIASSGSRSTTCAG